MINTGDGQLDDSHSRAPTGGMVGGPENHTRVKSGKRPYSSLSNDPAWALGNKPSPHTGGDHPVIHRSVLDSVEAGIAPGMWTASVLIAQY